MTIKTGYLKNINNFNIYHNVDTNFGSAGSPIILLSRKYKIIGIHRAYNKTKKLKIGINIFKNER